MHIYIKILKVNSIKLMVCHLFVIFDLNKYIKIEIKQKYLKIKIIITFNINIININKHMLYNINILNPTLMS